MKSEDISRRSFLTRAAAVSAGVALAGISTGSVISEAKASEPKVITPKFCKGKVRLACVGIGAQGNNDTKAFYKSGLCDVVVLCDTDLGSEATAEIEGMFPNAKKFHDFREMFDKASKDFDAVLVAVPDHSHFPITMLAMMSGKHVYVEKPMARTFEECELLMAAEKKYGVVTQMGNQGHSGDNYYQFKALTEAGIIKNVRSITAHMNSSRRWHKWNPKMQSYPAAEPMPTTLDWDTWLSVCDDHDYQKDFVRGQWRCWYDFGMGALGDWGAHIMDTAHQFLELGLPTEITPTYLKDHNPFFYPMSTTLEFKFPARKGMPECVITWKDGLDNIPEVPDGYTTGSVDSDIPPVAGQAFVPEKLAPGKEIYSDGLILQGGSHSTPLKVVSGSRANEAKKYMDKYEKDMPDHYTSFLLACQGKCKTTSPFSISGPLSQVFCLGVMAQRFGTKIVFDPVKKRITNNPLADAMLRGERPRDGWEKFYKI